MVLVTDSPCQDSSVGASKVSPYVSSKRVYPPVKPGDMFGELKILALTTKKSPFGKVYRMACSCGQRITIPVYYCRRDVHPKKHCGSKVHSTANPYPRERGIWHMMHVRCYDPSHVAYRHYGGRGIGIYVGWHKNRGEAGWEAFIKYMGPAPSIHHSIDRFPDNNGSYVPGNVRWATSKEQRANQRPRGTT